jgi:hypothetical protein
VSSFQRRTILSIAGAMDFSSYPQTATIAYGVLNPVRLDGVTELILTDVRSADSFEMRREFACHLSVPCSAIPRRFPTPNMSQDEIVQRWRVCRPELRVEFGLCGEQVLHSSQIGDPMVTFGQRMWVVEGIELKRDHSVARKSIRIRLNAIGSSMLLICPTPEMTTFRDPAISRLRRSPIA